MYYKYFFRAAFYCTREKEPFEDELNNVFLYLWNMFWILSFSIFVSIGFITASSSKFCWPLMLMKSVVAIPAFLFLPIFAGWILCTFLSVLSIRFPFALAIWIGGSLLLTVLSIKNPFWFLAEIFLNFSPFFQKSCWPNNRWVKIC